MTEPREIVSCPSRSRSAFRDLLSRDGAVYGRWAGRLHSVRRPVAADGADELSSGKICAEKFDVK